MLQQFNSMFPNNIVELWNEVKQTLFGKISY